MAEIKNINDTPLTDNCKTVLCFLQDNDSEWVGSDLSQACGVKGIHPVCNSLIKRGLVQKGSVEREFENKKGQKGIKAYVTYSLTDIGRDFIA